MQPLTSYWPATLSPGDSWGRNEYGLPQNGHQPSDDPLPSELDRPTGFPQFQQNRLDSGTTGLVMRASRGSISRTRGISTRPPPRCLTGGSTRVATVIRSCGSVSMLPPEMIGKSSSSSKSGRKSASVACGRGPVTAPLWVSAGRMPGPTSCAAPFSESLPGSFSSSDISPHTWAWAGQVLGREPSTTCGTTCSMCRPGGCVRACR